MIESLTFFLQFLHTRKKHTGSSALPFSLRNQSNGGAALNRKQRPQGSPTVNLRLTHHPKQNTFITFLNSTNKPSEQDLQLHQIRRMIPEHLRQKSGRHSPTVGTWRRQNP